MHAPKTVNEGETCQKAALKNLGALDSFWPTPLRMLLTMVES